MTALVSIFASKYPQLQQRFRSSSAFNYNPKYLGDVTQLCALRLIQVTNNLFRRSDGYTAPGRFLSLETLVSTLQTFEASRPEDTIFAVLSLASDVNLTYLPRVVDAPQFKDDIGNDLQLTEKRIKAAAAAVKVFRNRLERKTYPSRFNVNYGNSFVEVCKEFLSWTLARSESLDIICRPWAPVTRKETLPSWICTLSGLAFKTGSRGIHT
jgi:hypothetical protein